MKIFIWQRIINLTDNWHPEGGVVAIAENDKEAREMIRNAKMETYHTSKPCTIEDEKPDFVCECNAKEKKVYIFPDTGCC